MTTQNIAGHDDTRPALMDLQSEAERGNVIDYANCIRRLLVKLDKGEVVNKGECK